MSPNRVGGDEIARLCGGKGGSIAADKKPEYI